MLILEFYLLWFARHDTLYISSNQEKYTQHL